METPLIQISRMGTTISRSGAQIEKARERFHEQHAIVLHGFLDRALLDLIRRQIARASFHDKQYDGFGGRERALLDGAAVAALLFTINVADVFGLIQAVTSCGPIGSYVGRIYALRPGHDEGHDWHDDNVHHRLLAMSVNLSDGTYAGGNLQIRDTRTRSIVFDAHNTGMGDAVLFAVAEGLEHRVLPVAGAIEKVSLAGWFVSEPAFIAPQRLT